MKKSPMTLFRLGLFLLVIATTLAACGGGAVRPTNHVMTLADALSRGDKALIQQARSHSQLTPIAQKLVRLRLLQLDRRALQMTGLSQPLLAHFTSLTPAQQSVLRELALWAFAQQIYRKEIGRSVRILQRERLYLAPSHINLSRCVRQASGCANSLRQRLGAVVDVSTLNQTLMDMARRDPCVNLSDTLQSGDKAHRCLRKQMGEESVELLPASTISATQWQHALQ